MVWLLALLVKVAITLLLTVAVAGAQDRRQNEPGQFDFYVLALSWSPSFCEAAGERGTPPQQQCAARPIQCLKYTSAAWLHPTCHPTIG